MSILSSLGTELQHLPAVLAEYEEDFRSIATHLKMKGNPLDQMLIDQASFVGHYQIRQAELKSIRKGIESRIDRVRGKLWKQYTEHHPRELNYRDKENYVNFDPDLVELKNKFHEVSELEERYGAACDALQQKGFMLNALVKAKTGGFDSIIL